MALKKRKTKSGKKSARRKTKVKFGFRNYAVLFAAELILLAFLSFLFFSHFNIAGLAIYDTNNNYVKDTPASGYYLAPGHFIDVDAFGVKGRLTNPADSTTTRFIPTRVEAGFQSFMANRPSDLVYTPATSVTAPTSTNNPPTITSSPVLIVNEGQAYSYNVIATDSEGNALTYSLSATSPAWLSINPSTGVVSGTALAVTSNQNYNVVVTVSDGTSSANQAYVLAVSDTSVSDTQAPTVAITSPTNTDYTSQVTQLSYAATDNVGAATCWYSTNLGVTTSTPVACSGVFSITSTEGTNTWTVYAKDASGNIGSATATFTVSLSAVSHTFLNIDSATPAVKDNFNLEAKVKKVEVKMKNSVPSATFVVTGYDARPTQILDKSGKVYKYFQITTDASNTNLEKATITTQVEKSWLSANGLSRDSVSTFKFDGTNWNELPTTYSSEDSTYYYYTFELTSFSYFAIGEENVAATQTPSSNGGGSSGCGNGRKTGSEQCDDNDRISGDGCSSVCRIESGYACTGGNPSICTRSLNVAANTFCLDGACSSSTTTYTPSDTSDLAYIGNESGFVSGGPVEKIFFKGKLSFYAYIFIAVLLIGGTILTGIVLLRKWHVNRKINRFEQEAVREEHHLAGEMRGEIRKEERKFGFR